MERQLADRTQEQGNLHDRVTQSNHYAAFFRIEKAELKIPNSKARVSLGGAVVSYKRLSKSGKEWNQTEH